MSQYQEFKVSFPEEISKIAELFEGMKNALDVLLNFAKAKVAAAKLQASGADLQLMAMKTVLDEIINELEKLKGGTFSGITAHPYAYRIRAGYDRVTDTMTLTPLSALQQVKEAFDDEGDPLAPDKVNNYGGFVIVGSAPGISEFAKLVLSIGKFFSKQELIDLAEQIEERWEEKKSGVKAVVKMSKGIDFEGYSQAELFPEYVDLINEIQAYPEGIRSGIISASDSLDDAMAFLDKKLAKGESIVRKIKNFLDKFTFEISDALVHYKTFKREENTADTIKAELLRGMPDVWKTSRYSIVLGVFAGSESIELIFEIMSLD